MYADAVTRATRLHQRQLYHFLIRQPRGQQARAGLRTLTTGKYLIGPGNTQHRGCDQPAPDQHEQNAVAGVNAGELSNDH